MNIYGLDFTSVPTGNKPITCVHCRMEGTGLVVEGFEGLSSLAGFESFLQHEGRWVAGMDFPFGQPRKLIENLGWPKSWASYVCLVNDLSKTNFDALLKAYRDARPRGDKQHLRATDLLAKSKSPMMMYGVPVGKMFLVGAPRLLKSGANVLPCHPTGASRVILEAYPALVARRWSNDRPYKTDNKQKQNAEREAVRVEIVDRLLLETEKHFGFQVNIPAQQAIECIKDSWGDKLDALLCAVQAGWGYLNRDKNYGIPAKADILEGWIVDPELWH